MRIELTNASIESLVVDMDADDIIEELDIDDVVAHFPAEDLLACMDHDDIANFCALNVDGETLVDAYRHNGDADDLRTHLGLGADIDTLYQQAVDNLTPTDIGFLASRLLSQAISDLQRRYDSAVNRVSELRSEVETLKAQAPSEGGI